MLSSAAATPPTSPKVLSDASAEPEARQIASIRRVGGCSCAQRQQLRELVFGFVKLSGVRVEVSTSPALQRLVRAVTFLRSCGYATQDVILVLAHASVYCDSIREQVGQMKSKEGVNVLMVLMFMAHSYVLDSHCPLRTWHRYLFQDYCNLSTLECAIMSLMKLRGYVLRVSEDVLEVRVSELSACMANCACNPPVLA
jgi:hypothetical protein